MGTDMSDWTPAFSLAELGVGGVRVFVHGPQRIAVFRLEDGSVTAIDDRCPHEGYPLSKGFVNGCVITCRWHSFRFDVHTGKCLVGDEPVRVYPVRMVADIIELDLSEPDVASTRKRLEASLWQGLERRRSGQVARDVVRLLDTGLTSADITMYAVRFDAERAPYGTSHVPALAHDILARLPALTSRHGVDGQVAALLQVLDLAAEASLSFPPRVRPEPRSLTSFAELRACVEAEDAESAEALVRGAFADGIARATIEEWIRSLASDHLLDIGHGFIFPPKVFALMAQHDDVATNELVLGALVRRITLGTREELVPEWSWVTRALNANATPDEEGLRGNLGPLIRALLDGTRKEIFDALERVIASRPFDAVVDALVLAASMRLLRYDLHIEVDPTIQESWLDVTHALTLASALRDYATLDSATRRRVLFYAAAFIHTRAGLDAPVDLRVLTAEEERILFGVSASELALLPLTPPDVFEQVQQALGLRQADRLVRLAESLYISDRAALVAALEDWCLMRPATRSIFAAHQWKTLVCGDLESQHLAASADPFIARAAALPLLAAARFIGAPLTERAPLQAAHEALRFVRESRVPRRRT